MEPAASAAAMSVWEVGGDAGSGSHVQVAVHRVAGPQPASPSHISPGSTIPLPHEAAPGSVVVVVLVRTAVKRTRLRPFTLNAPCAVPQSGAGMVTASLALIPDPHCAKRAFTSVARRLALTCPVAVQVASA